MTQFIPQMEPWFGEEEKRAVADYLDTGAWITEFRKTQEFEEMLSDYVGTKHCIISSNGTTALMMMMWAAGLKAGDEVIVPNFTMIASANAVYATGATPVFADVEAETLCLDLDAAEVAITDKTKAMLFVNINGRNPKHGIDAYKQLCDRKGILFLEDSCQALGSRYEDGRHMGTRGLSGTLSFSVPKVISTGQGGAVFTDDDEFAVKLQKMKDFGRSGGGNDIHDSIGYNFKFTDMQAAIGVEQMKKLAWRVERKKDIYALYRKNLEEVAQISFFDQDLERTTPWFIDVMVSDRAALQEHLKAAGIGSRVMYPPINKQEAYQVPGEHPVSNLVGEKGLWLPSAAQLSDADVTRITKAIRGFYVG